MKRVWIVDDDRNLLKILAAVVKDGGHDVTTFESAEAAWSRVEGAAGSETVPDLVLADLQMPGWDGIELLRRFKRGPGEVPFVLLTAHGSIDRAVEAMKEGAYDFLTKPVESEKLLLVARNALEHGELRAEVGRFRARRREELRATMVGQSAAIREVSDAVARVAPQTTTVLITGETGTGKEVVARAIHAASRRATEPFVAVNCGAIPEGLVESELFGHVRGSFTGAIRDRRGYFESADGGTLFLDEIGDLPATCQTRLLRALEERTITRVGDEKPRKVDVRIVAATNRDLKKDVEDRRFREDLFYRIHVFPIRVAALRDRRDDIPLLAGHFLARLSGGETPPDVSPESLKVLCEYSWPGNVRELQNVIERAMVLSGEDRILPEHLVGLTRASTPAPAETAPLRIPDEGINLDDVERQLLDEALKKTSGNQSRAARLLGITRSALIYRLEKHNIR
jgi:DNA-binding NtrC family response regulator